MVKSAFYFLVFLVLASCYRSKETPNEPTSFCDSVLCNIYDLGRQKDYSALVSYLKHPNSLYRQEALLELTSISSNTIVDSVLMLLNDTSEEVRLQAAFTLGYFADSTLAKELIVFLQEESETFPVKVELVKSIGKLADSAELNWLLSYHTTNSDYLYAQLVAVASAKQRGIFTTKAMNFLQNYPDTTLAKRIMQLTPIFDTSTFRVLNLETPLKPTFSTKKIDWKSVQQRQKYYYLSLPTQQRNFVVQLFLDKNPAWVIRLEELDRQQFFHKALFRETPEAYLWELPNDCYELPHRFVRGSVLEGTCFVMREHQKIWLAIAKTSLPELEIRAIIIGKIW
ncbi:MAG: HEAT repeat domain-containing protein [Cytophagales bacterium]|nr:HEAT repeat domain-containing protein [Cytophagales bacterium]MDW8384376.1 HEAT repeat domain-containing protein [Flammeovirgaceae bacterium]